MALEKKIHNYVTAKGLSSHELKTSELPDTTLIGVNVSFKSDKEIRYDLHHVCKEEASNDSYINLKADYQEGEDPDSSDNMNDFSRVKKIIMRETNPTNILDRGKEGSKRFDLEGELTASRIAELVNTYSSYFHDVKILEARYENVPVEKFEKSPIKNKLEASDQP